MDDGVKDRNPTWSPDGGRLAFMSTRNGEWELWSVRRDGADLRQMTDLRREIYQAVWAPDGRRVATIGLSGEPQGVWIVDPAGIATRETAVFRPTGQSEQFSPEAWSPDGKLIAGSIVDHAGIPRRAAVMDVATGAVRLFDNPPSEVDTFSFIVAGWLPDARRFLVASGRALALVDATSGRWSRVGVREGAARYSLSRDERTLMIERQVLDADVWLMELKP